MKKSRDEWSQNKGDGSRDREKYAPYMQGGAPTVNAHDSRGSDWSFKKMVA
ncbi:hypothetical protein GCM10007972_20990 [Iodidimonas muriae]|uniref:Uncharacterized protein n=1 Tax=Iodidimonas muriae TaxID=261467 RepID=A0ABQ2LEP4_9PROT|nr:hypothetical protein JCM17843_18290 [Kordiimonadales bacterium JCM 17843]GGO14161.1 hypothetical protein GCM10007972_20990 [Iodidimonas muriae]